MLENVKEKRSIFLFVVLILLSAFIPSIIADVLILENKNKGGYNSTKSKISSPEFEWNPDGLIVCNESGDQTGMRMIDDGNGKAILVWTDQRDGNLDIYTQKIDEFGNRLWEENGILVHNSTGIKNTPVICTDGSGGVILAWIDLRPTGQGPYYDGIYAQRIDSEGNRLWNTNGTVISNFHQDDFSPSICSDGEGGAIITWYRRMGDIDNRDVFAQKVNSVGDCLWDPNGTVVCNYSFFQLYPKVCSDGEGGAIIGWSDRRDYYHEALYVQRINSTGQRLWEEYGIHIADTEDESGSCSIISDGFGGAILAWRKFGNYNYDLYAERINSSGDTLWSDFGGIAVAAEQGVNNNQYYPNLCSDGAGGAIVVYVDNPEISSEDDDLYAQKINSTGNLLWDSGGLPICTAQKDQTYKSIVSDGVGGVMIVWSDYRDSVSTGSDTYAQFVNSSGDIQWQENGEPIIKYSDNQLGSKVITIGGGNFYFAWYDDRFGDYDIYAQYMRNKKPIVNNPEDIYTDLVGIESINWTISDDNTYGKYRIISNNTNGEFYIWQNWTTWCNGTILSIPLNLSVPGSYNYTIEYYDYFNLYGDSDTVIVNIINSKPRVDPLPQIVTYLNGTETIDWIITDDGPSGEYRVWVNNSLGEIYLWMNWSVWVNNSILSVPINRSNLGEFNYILEFRDINGLYGDNNTVIIIVSNNIPSLTIQDIFITSFYSTDNLSFRIYDDGPSGYFRVIANNTFGNYYIWKNWSFWTSGDDLILELNRSNLGTFNYTIEYYDINSQYGNPKSAIIKVINIPPSCSVVPEFNTSIYSSDTIDWMITDDGPSGQYRVWANNTSGDYYLWKNWTSWSSSNDLNLEINRSSLGTFNYTIEYFDDFSEFGQPSHILITLDQEIPTINSLTTINTSIYSSDTINWIITDDGPSGQYRVWANDTSGDYYLWKNWTNWINNTDLQIQINRSVIGSFHYIIDYYDEYNVSGINGEVEIDLINLIPSINTINYILNTSISGSETINWIISDDGLTGYYRVLINDSQGEEKVWIDWESWLNGESLHVPIDRSEIGYFSYRIEFYDEFGVSGLSQEVMVHITTSVDETNSIHSDFHF
ncbi:MAG: hypothetical protein GF311_07655 [Candidatus Lokiarchaeota archaeon]|nr:hypothetical protein [Candidatus Lokiarchaeota archaeon]